MGQSTIRIESNDTLRYWNRQDLNYKKILHKSIIFWRIVYSLLGANKGLSGLRYLLLDFLPFFAAFVPFAVVLFLFELAAAFFFVDVGI